MRFFKSAATGAVHAYDDDVVIESDASGVYTFTTAHGLRLDVPADLQPCAEPGPTEMTVEQKQAALSGKVQEHLDQAAQDLGYDDIRSAVTYADEQAVPKFQAEGRALRAWRSEVWAACYDLLDQWSKGKIEEPTPEDVIAALPAFQGVASA